MKAEASGVLEGAAAPALGLALAVASIVMQGGSRAPEWTIWAPVALAVGLASGTANVYGRRRLRELTTRYQLASGPLWRRTALLLLVAVVIYYVPLVLPGAARATPSTIPLPVVAFVLGAPLVTSMFAVRAALDGGPLDAPRGRTLKQLVDLRQVLDRVLATAGGLVALVTIEFSTRQLLNQSMHTQGAARPASYTLIFGAFGSLIVGIAYFSSWGALRSHGQTLLNSLVPIHMLDVPSDVIEATRERRELASALGIDRSILSDLTAGIVILSPIISGAIATYIAD